jgi:hypothetical protein
LLSAIGGILLSSGACSEPATRADASTRPDAPVLFIDAGPKTYEQFEDFTREGCDDDGSLASFAFLGKWQNVPDDGSTAFDSYFTMDGTTVKGILDLIPADIVLVDGDNLFLHRRYNLTSLAVNLCAVVDGDTLFGHMAKCNGMACTTGTLNATLVEPITQ